MSSDFLFRLRALFRRNSVETELDAELRAHLKDEAANYVAAGMPRDEAARRARLALGGLEQIKEQCRDARGTRWLEDLLQDFRYAIRTLRQRPGFAAVALLTLALGSGATTVMFTVINGVLLKPLSYPQPDKLVAVHGHRDTWNTDIYGEQNVAYPDFLDCQQGSRTLAMAGALYNGGTVSEPGDPEYVDLREISPGLFSVLRVNLAQGRTFLPEEDRIGAAPVMILGAVTLVLLIACANVASLLLARAVSRERELAMRVALGATRGRLVRQCLTESSVLGLSGGVLGILLAGFGIRPFLNFWPGTLPRAEEVQLDWHVLLFALAASLLSGLLFGLAPALRAPAEQVEQTLRAGARTVVGSSRRLHSAFVISENHFGRRVTGRCGNVGAHAAARVIAGPRRELAERPGDSHGPFPGSARRSCADPSRLAGCLGPRTTCTRSAVRRGCRYRPDATRKQSNRLLAWCRCAAGE